jgi:hypothetical protein
MNKSLTFAVALMAAGATTTTSFAAGSTADVMEAMPPGTVMFFSNTLPNPIPSGWGNWAKCPDTTLVRIDQLHPGTAYPGANFSDTFTTIGQVSGADYSGVNNGSSPPQAPGNDHQHRVTVNVPAGSYMPPAQNFSCLQKN